MRELPEKTSTELVTGIDTLGIGLPDGVNDVLISYLKLLVRWNKTYNLTAIRDPVEMVTKHLLDSLAVLPYLGEGDIVDVGSGAGLPGIPFAIARPEQSITLIDTNGKKTRFLNQAKIELGLDNVEVVHARVEEHRREDAYDVVVSRAYANTDDFITSTQHLHDDTTRIFVMQGKLDESLHVDGYVVSDKHTLQVPGLDAERHLLLIARR